MRFTSNTYSCLMSNLYAFQGQENDDEIKGDGNSVNYKYRMHDPRLGRFFAIDPLASKYPYNSVYAFSENRVLDAIELEGLEAFFIHGTASSPSRWNQKAINVIKSLTNNHITDAKFSWEDLDGYFNDSEDRHKAALRLVKHIEENRVKGEEITLIGHSHGGNVAIQAAKLWYQKTGEQVNLITIATPTYEDETNKNWEDPGTTEGKKAINDHIHLYNLSDGIQGGFAGGEKYESSSITRQTLVDIYPTYNPGEWLDAHSFDADHPELIQREIDDGCISGKLDKIELK